MRKRKNSMKVVEFTQSETNTKTFRPDLPITDELKDIMVKQVLLDFKNFAMERFFSTYHQLFTDYVEELKVPDEKRKELIFNLFWWRLFLNESVDLKSGCIEEYISENFQWLRKRPILISWLRRCGKAVPKFYHIGYMFNNRVFVGTDMLKAKPLDIMILDPDAIPPKRGEIAVGILLPLGDGLFFPITDFYHFEYEARQQMANHFFYYYEKHLQTSSENEAFIHVLSAMLQIEKIVSNEQLEKTPSI